MANGRCKNHGGKSPAGIASPSFKQGKYSQVLPRRMREAYERAAADPNLLTLTHELGVVEARILDLLGRVNTG
jgi:hypothetical protein